MAKQTAPQRGKTSSPLKALVKVLAWGFVALLVAGPSILHSNAGIGFSPILTGSMRPYANPGDVFITKQTTAADLRVGDVIAVNSQTSGVFYAHRIAEISTVSGRLRVITKGDANSVAELDPLMVSPQGLVSKEIIKVKWLGRPMIYLTSLQGRQAGLALMVFANVVGLFLFLFRKQVKDKNPLHLQVYKDLYAEAQAAHVRKTRELTIFKEILEANFGDRKFLETELAKIEQEMNEHQQLPKEL